MTAASQPYTQRLDKDMREKEPQFTVTDRRKFTAEGELREGESKASESSPPPVVIPVEPELMDDGDTILDDMVVKANPGQPAPAAMNFDRLVQSLYMTAAVQMGAGGAPNEQPRIDILGARQSIDMLTVLDEKTKGNLSDEEKRLLQNALFDLRMSFLEITNAIASSAQRPPQAAKPPQAGKLR
jgi:hypothetical protein